MIVVLKPDASDADADMLFSRMREMGLKARMTLEDGRKLIGAIGDAVTAAEEVFREFPFVESVKPTMTPYLLASRNFRKENTQVAVADGTITIGGKTVVVMAGPCAVENYEMLREIAGSVKEAGATVLRGGAYKHRTSPYAFQGLGEEALIYLHEVGNELGMPIVTEVTDTRHVELAARYADILQIGSRNMQNYNLLLEAGKIGKPVLLKRSMYATLENLLLCAEYILSAGNEQVILCERGIKTFEDSLRNTLDVAAIPNLKQKTHLPIVIDPSHASGHWGMIEPLSRAAVAAGADGLLIEVHNRPEKARCDGHQSVLPDRFARLVENCRPIAEAVGRKIP
ncbi:MAG: 3-deoxy-7-phosphoheptulonate synthase [Planctomycetota bacterium]|jgi:3-deoxy-7-phosphoheptulonate synthase